MERTQKESAAYRRANASKFKQIGGEGANTVYGGYQPGIINGPAPSTERGKARTKCNWRNEQ